MKKRYCTKETCPYNQDTSNSPQISNAQKNAAKADKETQRATDHDVSSEYDIFYDCGKGKHEPQKFPDISELDMNHVYESMENPKLFRGTLMQVTLLTQQLLNYFEQPPTLAPSKCNLIKNNHNSTHKAKKPNSFDHEVVPWQQPAEYIGSKKSSFECMQLHIPIELQLSSLYEQFKPRDFSKCTDPLCNDIAKAVEPYIKAASSYGIAANTPSRTEPSSISSTYYSCMSKDHECQLPTFGSKNIQTTPVPLYDAGFMPPCWCSITDRKKDQKPKVLCKCGFIPDNCHCNRVEKVELEPPAENEITSPSKLTTAPPEETASPPYYDEYANTEPCKCGDLAKETISEEKFKCLCVLTAPSEDTVSPLYDDDYSIVKPCKCGEDPANQITPEEILRCAYDLNLEEIVKPLTPPKPPTQVYRMVYPQHKDLDICVKCRFDPSPLMDEVGKVFCPGNCGCCLCPWKTRPTHSAEDALRHRKIKVCKCRDRCTIFTGITVIDSACSQSSYFDVCPCREKAEFKHLELYGTEISKTIMQGDIVHLSDVKELVPAKIGCKRFLTSKLYNETKGK